MRIISAAILLCFHFVCIAQNSLLLEGHYQSKNIFVQNPGGNCTRKVILNGKEIPFTPGDVFVIPLDSMGFKAGDTIRLEIFSKKDCLPKVLTDNSHKRTYCTESFSVDSNAVLHWTGTGRSSTFIIEQFLWNKWQNVGQINQPNGKNKNEYYFQVKPHSGKNQFRLQNIDVAPDFIFSPVIIYQSDLPEVKILPCKHKKAIEFDRETMYEVYEQHGYSIHFGKGKVIDISKLAPGPYFLNYDNKMGEFIVKKNRENENVIGKCKG